MDTFLLNFFLNFASFTIRSSALSVVLLFCCVINILRYLGTGAGPGPEAGVGEGAGARVGAGAGTRAGSGADKPYR